VEGRLTDVRKPQGKRHPLPSLISVLVAGMTAACTGPLAVAQAAKGWSQEVLEAHGCRVSPRTGLRVPPSASMLDRLGKLLDADELEAALTGTVAAPALGPALPVTHAPGIVIAQDKVAKAGKANEITHFRPLLAPLPLDDVVVTSDAMQANRDNALYLREAKNAHYLWPVLGNQPSLSGTLNALPW